MRALCVLAVLSASAVAEAQACVAEPSVEWALDAGADAASIVPSGEAALLVTTSRRGASVYVIDAHGARVSALPAIALDARDAFVQAIAYDGGWLLVRTGARGECATEACVIVVPLDAAGANRGAPLVVNAAPHARFGAAIAAGERALVHLDLAERDDDVFVVEWAGRGLVLGDRRTLPTAGEAPCPEARAHVAYDGAHVAAFVDRDPAPPGARGPTCPGLVAIVDRSSHAGAALHDTLRDVQLEGGELVGLALREDGTASRMLRWRAGAVGIDERSVAAGELPPAIFDVVEIALRAGEPRHAAARFRRLDGVALGEPIDLGATGRASFAARSGARFWVGELLGTLAKSSVRITRVGCSS